MASQRSNIIAANSNHGASSSSNGSSRSNTNNGCLVAGRSSHSPTPPANAPMMPMSMSMSTSSSSSSSRGHNDASFQPGLILSQILCLQCFHYFVIGLIFQVNHVLYATTVTIDRIFTDEYLNVWSAYGWIDNAAVLTSCFVGSLLLALVVEKSKKCLDFSVTLFVVHVVLCSVYSGKLPSTWDWWIVHVMGMITMVVMGEYFCSKRELSDIPLLVL